MHTLGFFTTLSITILLTLAGNSQEIHLNEAGSGPLLAWSTFAHGYRHGYEAGYHLGNVDINMARTPRVKRKTPFSAGNTGYSSQFGSKKSFVEGFHAGLRAGYYDGYLGREFRAVDLERTLAEDMEATPSGNSATHFDSGMSEGYRVGFAQGQSSPPPQASLDFERVSCTASPPLREAAFCDGYRRGFVFGQTDALVLRHGEILEASK